MIVTDIALVLKVVEAETKLGLVIVIVWGGVLGFGLLENRKGGIFLYEGEK